MRPSRAARVAVSVLFRCAFAVFALAGCSSSEGEDEFDHSEGAASLMDASIGMIHVPRSELAERDYGRPLGRYNAGLACATVFYVGGNCEIVFASHARDDVKRVVFRGAGHPGACAEPAVLLVPEPGASHDAAADADERRPVQRAARRVPALDPLLIGRVFGTSTTLNGAGPLSWAERELVNATTSRLNQCFY
jgi:hypothetical protein